MTRVTIAGFGRPGLIRDLAGHDLTPEAWNEVRNARFGPYGARAFGGDGLVLDTAVVPPYWLKAFPPITSPLWVYAGLEKVYAYDGSSHTDITRLAGDYSAAVQERWQGEVFNGLGIFNNTFDVPQLWSEFDASTPLVDLTNWPATLRCKVLRPHGFFLIALYTIESSVDRPYRIRWSHPAAPGTVPASWALNDPTVDSGEFDEAESPDYIVDGLSLGQLFIVYKQKSTYAMQFVGRPNIFAKWPILPTRGLLTRDCVTAIPQGHFAVSTDDIYVHTGQRESDKSIVEATLRDWVFRQIDTANFFNCYVVNYERRGEVWFCFPESGETFPTLALVWNRITGGVGVRDLFGSPYIYPGPVETTVSMTWDGSGAGIGATGAVETAKVVLAGIGDVIQHLSGLGGLAAGIPAVAGFGSVNDAALHFTGSGALVIGKSTVAGAGHRELEGAGSLLGKKPTVLGESIKGILGDGALSITESTLASEGIRGIEGTGAPASSKPTVAGTGLASLLVTANNVSKQGSGFSFCGNPGSTGTPGTTVSGGSGNYTYSWSRVSAPAERSFICSNASAQNPSWRPTGNTACADDSPVTETWRVDVVDTVTGQEGSDTITVTITWIDLS